VEAPHRRGRHGCRNAGRKSVSLPKRFVDQHKGVDGGLRRIASDGSWIRPIVFGRPSRRRVVIERPNQLSTRPGRLQLQTAKPIP
jgi:hypothetical protein